MSKGLKSGFFVAAVLVAGASGAHASETCKPFSVFSNNDDQKIAFVDHGVEGLSVGDRRIVYAPLHDAAGELVGHLDSETTHMHPDGEGNTRTSTEVTLQFPNGVITYKVVPLQHVPDFNDTSGLVVPDALRFVSGGAGVFAGASGAVDVERSDDSIELLVDVSCP